jgi:hypothetical protein
MKAETALIDTLETAKAKRERALRLNDRDGLIEARAAIQAVQRIAGLLAMEEIENQASEAAR